MLTQWVWEIGDQKEEGGRGRKVAVQVGGMRLLS